MIQWLRNIIFRQKANLEEKEAYNREVRVSLVHSDVYFKPQNLGRDSLLDVINISHRGMGLDKTRLENWQDIGESLPGKLFLKDLSLDVVAKIIHKTEQIIGCEFVNLPNHFSLKLSEFLEVEFSALKLVQIKPKFLKSPLKGTPYYFHGKNNDELYFIINEKNIDLLNIMISDQFLSGGGDTSFKSGKIINEDYEKVHGYKRAEPVEWTNEMDKELVLQARKFINNIEGLSAEHKELLQQKLLSIKV